MNEVNTLSYEELEALKTEKKAMNANYGSYVFFGLYGSPMKLLMNSSLGENEKDEIEFKILNGGINEQLYLHLLMHQLDPVTQGESYSQSDILMKLYKLSYEKN